ncbi:MAG: hypothetical protein JW995_01655 [Melioribacteraceae bacterium]|nr:hypothetical protein [Melioribacteraceae bacterium]
MNYEEMLTELVLKNERFIVLTAENRAAIRNLPNKIKNNFIDTGITEQTLVGISAGLALRGRYPIVHALASFLTMRAFEFIRTDVGISNLPVKLVGSFAGFLSEANGPTHQAIEDVSLMRGIPNVNVFCPADESDMMKGLPRILQCSDPFYIRYNNLKSQVIHSNFEMGSAEVFGSGNNVAILTYGTLFGNALHAKDLLEANGISVRLLNLRTLKPIDETKILEAARDCELIVTIEDHFLTGGLFSILSELLVKYKITANVLPLALNERWFKPGLLENVIEHEGFTGPQLARRIQEKLFSNKNTEYYAEWSNI